MVFNPRSVGELELWSLEDGSQACCEGGSEFKPKCCQHVPGTDLLIVILGEGEGWTKESGIIAIHCLQICSCQTQRILSPFYGGVTEGIAGDGLGIGSKG